MGLVNRNVNAQVGLLQAAHRRDITRVHGRPWPRYHIDGRPRPDAAPLLAWMVGDGLLQEQPTDDEAVRLVVPTAVGLARIGATR